MEDGVAVNSGWRLGTSVAPHVWSNGSISCIGQCFGLMLPGVAQVRKAVAKQDGRSASGFSYMLQNAICNNVMFFEFARSKLIDCWVNGCPMHRSANATRRQCALCVP